MRPSQGVFTRKVSVLPRPIRPETFAERIQGVDNATSAGIYYALQGAHLLDLKDMLVQDPRCARAINTLSINRSSPVFSFIPLEKSYTCRLKLRSC